jgi:uncharacterized protein with ATP-grasp and redox domains
MKPYPECSSCILKWIYERVANSLTDQEKFTVLKKVMSVLSRDLDPSINLGVLCNRSLRAVEEFFPASASGYQAFKRKCNQAAEKVIEGAEAFIEKADTPGERFVRACGIAAVGNVAPIGAPSAPFEFSHVEKIIQGEDPEPVSVGDIYDAVTKAHQVFYVADNAGEIGFDSLLIALLKEMGSKVTLVVKKDTFFDDATLDDFRYFGLEKMVDKVYSVKLIFDPEDADPELTLSFKNSDLVISKGTGNFEALKGYPGKKILFLLKSKCRPVSLETSTPQGEFVVRLEA